MPLPDLLMYQATTCPDIVHALDLISTYIGHTPVRQLRHDKAALFVKLEYNNYSGSIKDRAVLNILRKGVELGYIDKDTTVIESSSGNFAISLASMCRFIGIRSIVVIDPNINSDYERMVNLLATQVIKVTERDRTGGYLLSRIDKVNELCAQYDNIYWTNQYENKFNFQAYYHGLGLEICDSFDELDYVFVGVSTGGSIAGISRRIKEKFPQVKIVAVDIEGSVIFGQPPKKRYISGLGSSKVPGMIGEAIIDEVVHVAEINVVKGCRELLQNHTVFGGGSTGAMYYAATEFLATGNFDRKPVVLFLAPDKGAGYLDTVYNEEWVNRYLLNKDLATVTSSI